jgi:xanthine/uracil permease
VGREGEPGDEHKGEDGGDKDAALDASFEVAGRKIGKRKVRGGIIATVGFILSPVSWWNDLFVNIPIAYAFAALFALISEDLFLPAMVIGYWITNVLGFVLMHRGMKGVLSKDERKGPGRKEILTDLSVSVVYTIIVMVLVAMGILRLPTEYFP